MSVSAPHLVVAPVLLPLATAAAMLLLSDRRRLLKAGLNVLSTAAGLAIAIALLRHVAQGEGPAAFGIYLPGNWHVPFGIVLVADRLSAMMAVLTGCIGVASLLFSLARWQHAGVHFHVLFQLQLMGLYGAFLTGDLFNLFVFFEVLLAASYGLLLHGGGGDRVRAGLHYIAVNLVVSLLFLIGVAVLYGVTGTLNMADIAVKLAAVPGSDRGLLHAGAAILAIAFLAKAGLWPLNFWLPQTYVAASAPAAALFSILTKVGVYAMLRLWTLWFPADAASGASGNFGDAVLVWGGCLTLAFGAAGMLASQRLERLAGYSAIASSGTLVAAVGFDAPALSTGALFYLASSTVAGCAMFLMVELLDRTRQVEPSPPHLDDGKEALTAFTDAEHPIGTDSKVRTDTNTGRVATENLDDDQQALFGRALPAALAFLGVAFAACALITAGLPPLSGFVGKLAMLTALVQQPGAAPWVLFALLIGSGLCAALALMRIGIRTFWTTQDRPPPRLRVIEVLPIAGLLGIALALVVQAEAALGYARATADALHEPTLYIDAVLGARPVSDPAAPEQASR